MKRPFSKMTFNKVEKIFSPIEQSRASNEVEMQIETLILEGVLRVGDKLPSERELSKSMEVSRPILRNALASLEKRGLITIKHGGGASIANIIGTIFAAPVVDLIGRNPKAKADYLEYRKEIEGLTAGMAAQRVTPADKSLLKNIMDEMHKAHQAKDANLEAKIDVEFHSTIGECTHNIILVHTLRSCYALFSDDVFFNRKIIYQEDKSREALLNQHIEIYEAIISGESDKATKAARSHIDFIQTITQSIKQKTTWQEVSEQRLALRDNQ